MRVPSRYLLTMNASKIYVCIDIDTVIHIYICTYTYVQTKCGDIWAHDPRALVFWWERTTLTDGVTDAGCWYSCRWLSVLPYSSLYTRTSGKDRGRDHRDGTAPIYLLKCLHRPYKVMFAYVCSCNLLVSAIRSLDMRLKWKAKLIK